MLWEIAKTIPEGAERLLDELVHWFQTKEGDLVAWINAAEAAIRTNPLLAATVAGLLLLTCAISRSFSLAIASILCSGMILFAARVPEFDLLGDALTVSVLCVAVLILTGSLGFRRRLSKERSACRALLAEKNAIQQHLDEEIRWRRASEETEVAAVDAPFPPGNHFGQKGGAS